MAKHKRRNQSLRDIKKQEAIQLTGNYLKEQELIDDLSRRIQKKYSRKSIETAESGIPYPKVQVQDRNEKYAQILSIDFCSNISEFSAVAQYINHEIRITHKYKNGHKVLMSIAQTEMMHMQIIGELIVLLGGALNYSYYDYNSCSMWTPRFVDFGTDFVNMILLDINNEYKAIKQYEDHIKVINDKYIREILERIIVDEKYHIELLAELIEQYKHNEKDDIKE